ncbi:MAG: hypothetical protein COB15_17455, partial [Flavobacteriales bacterium]
PSPFFMSAKDILFLRMTYPFNLKHTFFEPTRITSTSAKCIDNIFCDCTVSEGKLFACLGSDHLGQQVSLIRNEESNLISAPVIRRPLTKYRKMRFRETINKKLPELDLTKNPNEHYNKIFNTVETEFKKTFPLKTFNNKVKLKFCDWATNGIYISRNKLYELYGQKQYNFNAEFISYVKRYSKTFKKVCSTAKSLYLTYKIKNSNDKIKTAWSIINKETGKFNPRDNNISLKIGDKTINSNDEVANEFNNFFANISKNITGSLSSCPSAADDLLKRNASDPKSTFRFRHISPEELLSAYKALNMKNTEDLWGISVSVLSTIIDLIAPHLTIIFNNCISDGVFPDLMKISKIIPLFKQGAKNDPTNYRPISILPALSKIFEKLILTQLVSYFNINKILHNSQFGFTKGRSTTDAAATLVGIINDAWEAGQDVIGVFCDLSKAFDCVDHNILKNKLKFYGVTGAALDVLSSYLDNRTQKVEINRAASNSAPVHMGVPQGSIIGPFLFLVYINDLPCLAQQLCDVILFADDTSLLFKVDRKSRNYNNVSNIMSLVLEWFTTNNLALNTDKTKCIKFSLSNAPQLDIPLVVNGKVLEWVHSAKFLGITVDSKFKWDKHIEITAKKLSSAAFAVRRIRQCTNIETARLVYYSYFHSIVLRIIVMG